ncbi:UvrD-helicase domain-containing protein [Flavobacteriaceae bacterium R38]|nr:UvrD-helicase domain-containing protein [Flavobacteriaceae bacterium R38]
MLVKEYLKILLSTNSPDSFKRILAITFTNKAVNEMKERIIENLEAFSHPSMLEKPSPMFSSLKDELKLSGEILIDRSAKTLKYILHNYAFFDVSTIDKFNHRLLRTFAFDLKLPMNFEVALDTEFLLEEAIDQLIFKAGKDEKLTKILVDFALEKAEDDKSWDIAIDLKRVALLLLNENHSKELSQLKENSLEDFIKLNKNLRKNILDQEEVLRKTAKDVLALIEANSLDFNDFSRGTLPNHFKKIASGNFDKLYDNKLGENLKEGKVYTKSLSSGKAEKIDTLLPDLLKTYETLKKGVYHLKFLQNFYKNSVPLSLLNAIQNELETIKTDQNLLLISEFNGIISEVIANEPAPFIYERIGEKYRHYFIDEFQDTSEMQWNNLVPLIGNVLEGETLTGIRGSLLIVGDAKQAIYRWRGGKAEQFIDLYNAHNPFQVEKGVTVLPKNYRSFKEVILFNNDFFKHISGILKNDNYKDLFQNKSEQQINDKTGGYVQLNFIDKEEDENQRYCELVLEQINNLIEEGFSYRDICILTQKKKQGLIIAGFLLEHKIAVISSESLLLKNNSKINFLINLITYTLQPKNKEIRLDLLNYLSEKEEIEDKHDYFIKYLDEMEVLFSNYDFNQSVFGKLPFLNAIEYAIYCFQLQDTSDAYLQFFLDEVLDFSIKQNSGLGNFITYWEKKNHRLSVVAPEGNDAVQIMTIHKSKGLEFPVVIYPYAQTNIDREIDPKVWLPVDKNEFGIDSGLFSKNKEVTEYSDFGKKIYEDIEAKLELDQFNVLYVAFTRAIERLYVFSKKEIKTNGEENLRSFSGLLINYLKSKSLWDIEKKEYTFGVKTHKGVKQKNIQTEEIPFVANNTNQPFFKIITKSGTLWDTSQEKALQKGNLYHFLLSQIDYEDDLEGVLQDAIQNGTINYNDVGKIDEDLSKLIHHPNIRNYFSRDYRVYNELDIYTSNGELMRPDRLAIDVNNRVTIIDYKTGAYRESFKQQLDKYAVAIEEMGFTIESKLLVFINEIVEIKAI